MKKTTGKEPEFVLVGEVIEEILEQKRLFPRTLYGAWEDIVGKEVARHSQPRRLTRNVLHVIVSDPVWKHHLEMNKAVIIDKLGELAGKQAILDIRFRLGEIREEAERFVKPKGTSGKKGKRSRRKTSIRKLTDEDKKVLKKISDVKLRKICRSLLKRVH